MEANGTDPKKSSKNSNSNGLVKTESEKVKEVDVDVDGEVDDESNLLSPRRKGGMSNKTQKKTRRKVQWNDRNGNKLVEILEFQPSDASDTDDDDFDSCICTVM